MTKRAEKKVFLQLIMDFRSLVRNLLIGFLPVVVFIAGDHFFSAHYGARKGMQYALMLAMALGLAQLVFIYVKEKRLDKMTLLDTGLVLVMGSISFVSGNDLFFKLKPALIEFIMVVMLGVMAFFSPRLLIAMAGRLVRGMEVTDMHLKLMQRNAMGMFFIFLLHTGLIVYSAVAMSRDAWAFISGGLFYILTGIYFAWIVVSARIKRRRMLKEAEYRPRPKIRKRG